MQKTELRINERKVEEFLDLHIKVLTGILQGKGFEQIREEYEDEFERLNYLEVATKYLSCLSFNEKANSKPPIPFRLRKRTITYLWTELAPDMPAARSMLWRQPTHSRQKR